MARRAPVGSLKLALQNQGPLGHLLRPAGVEVRALGSFLWVQQQPGLS